MTSPEGCVALRPREANRNPQIIGIEIARSALASAPFEPHVNTPDAPLLMAPGETIRIRPVFGLEDMQSYQRLESTLDDSTLVVSEKREELVVSWVSTFGRFENDRTNRLETKSIDNVFEAPNAGEGPQTGNIWMVVRDQRGGTGWRHISVRVM
jgi:hypothetical protein